MSNIFDDFYENLPKGRCHPCKYAKAINAGDDWVFLSCWHEPYKGKWVAEIKDCPRRLLITSAVGDIIELSGRSE